MVTTNNILARLVKPYIDEVERQLDPSWPLELRVNYLVDTLKPATDLIMHIKKLAKEENTSVQEILEELDPEIMVRLYGERARKRPKQEEEELD